MDQPSGQTGSTSPTAVVLSIQPSDTELLERIRNGDQQAFGQLVPLLFPHVYRAADRVLRQDQEAEDVAQEVFLKIWQNTPDLQQGAFLKAWAIRVATNGAIDRLRKRKPDLADEVPERADPAPDAQIALQKGEAASAIQAAIDALPERQRLALVLTYYEGLANKEAADLLEVSVDALESLLARARRGLKAVLADQWGELLEDLAQGGVNDGSWNTI